MFKGTKPIRQKVQIGDYRVHLPDRYGQRAQIEYSQLGWLGPKKDTDKS